MCLLFQHASCVTNELPGKKHVEQTNKLDTVHESRFKALMDCYFLGQSFVASCKMITLFVRQSYMTPTNRKLEMNQRTGVVCIDLETNQMAGQEKVWRRSKSERFCFTRTMPFWQHILSNLLFPLKATDVIVGVDWRISNKEAGLSSSLHLHVKTLKMRRHKRDISLQVFRIHDTITITIMNDHQWMLQEPVPFEGIIFDIQAIQEEITHKATCRI